MSKHVENGKKIKKKAFLDKIDGSGDTAVWSQNVKDNIKYQTYCKSEANVMKLFCP